MTVSELIKDLLKLDPDATIGIDGDDAMIEVSCASPGKDEDGNSVVVLFTECWETMLDLDTFPA